ncbi:MAG: tellurite resistance TerB family protein [Gammaproteobacteria bacterium]|nr:tellurite resistance TerB family protein [Gammaproteobacteria bacterium]MBU2278526.1 tellurite resistance TerB family protein [Gammaproteobacteria bacterium]
MNTKNLLDQLLRSGTELLQGKSSDHNSGYHPQSGQPQNTQPAGNLTDTLSSLLSGKSGAALAGGALGLLLGSKSGRKLGGTVLTYGGLAALGALAYKAYQNYQQQRPGQQTNPIQPFDQLPAPKAEAHSTVILIALIAAAKADGHIDDRERQLIDGEVAKLTSDPTLLHWVDRELKKPLDPAEVASHAKDQAMAAEMYLASLLTVDEQNFMEKSYLQELARQLKLDPALQAELALQVQQAVAATR